MIKHKKILSAFLAAAMIMGSIPNLDVYAASKPKLSKNQLVMYVGNTETLKLNNVKGKTSWRSNNKKAAIVNHKGLVTAKKAGTAKITATNKKNTYTCTVKIKDCYMSKKIATTELGKTITVKLVGATASKIKWSVNDKTKAIVSRGKITPKKEGIVTITALYAKRKYNCKVIISHSNHNYIITKSVKADCFNKGYKEYKCSLCGDIKLNNTDMLKHDFEQTDYSASTCLTAGYTELTCKLCGYKKYEESDKIKHEYKLVDDKTPTCLEKGYKKYTCSMCDSTYTDLIDKLEHNYKLVEETKENENTLGCQKYICENCKHTKIVNNYEDETSSVESTEEESTSDEEVSTDENETTEKQSDEEISTDENETTEKQSDEEISTDENETTEKQSDEEISTDENETTEKQSDEEISTDENETTENSDEKPTEEETTAEEECIHNYQVSNEIPPTCIDEGFVEYKCTKCKNIKKDILEIDENNHNYEELEKVEPKCNENGSIYRECSICGYGEREELPRLEHDYSNEYTIRIAPTYSTEGSKARFCKRCNSNQAYIDETTVPRLDTVTRVDSKGSIQRLRTLDNSNFLKTDYITAFWIKNVKDEVGSRVGIYYNFSEKKWIFKYLDDKNYNINYEYFDFTDDELKTVFSNSIVQKYLPSNLSEDFTRDMVYFNNNSYVTPRALASILIYIKQENVDDYIYGISGESVPYYVLY